MFPLKRTLSAFVAAAAVIGTLMAGCGKQEAANVDVTAIADSIKAGLTFQDTMQQLPETQLNSVYPTVDISTLNAFCVYKGASGGTAEEVAVFEAKDAEGVSALEEAVKIRLEDLNLQFESYVPAEVKKINDAVTATKGNVVVLVIADDSAAAQALVEEQLK